MVTKRYSRPDNVFCTKGISNMIMQCNVLPSLKPTAMDHFLIITKSYFNRNTLAASPCTTSERPTGIHSEENY